MASWSDEIFAAKAVEDGGVVRRAKRYVEQNGGIDALVADARARGFHVLETGDQMVIICNSGTVKLYC